MLRRNFILATFTITLGLTAGCSNRAAFEIMYANKVQACERMSEGQAREDCLRGYQKNYDQYERERNEVLGNKKRQAQELRLPTDKAKDESSN